jgi:hypothetical protein
MCVTFFSAGASIASAEGNPCPAAQVTDYLRGFRKMLPVRRVPSSGILPFGPSDLRLVGSGGLLPGGGRVGFQLGSNVSGRKHRLGWRVEVDVRPVNRNGVARQPLQVKLIELNRVRSFWRNPLEVMTHLPPRPAFYRMDIAIEKSNGVSLGRFGDYVRVVPYRIRAKLVLGSAKYLAGELATARVENPGTVGLSFGPRLRLEQRTASGWIEAPGAPAFWPPIAFEIQAGAVGKCERYRLPVALDSSFYRLSKQVEAGRKSFDIRSVFQVK